MTVYMTSCKTYKTVNIVSWNEIVDSINAIGSSHVKLDSLKYANSGGMDREKFLLYLALMKNSDKIDSIAQKKKEKLIEYYRNNPINYGMNQVKCPISNNEEINIFICYYGCSINDTSQYSIPESYIIVNEDNLHRLPVELKDTHFRVMKNPPFEYDLKCKFQYKDKTYLLHHHYNLCSQDSTTCEELYR